MSTPRIVILGAGHAGGTAAALLRQQGHAGSITMIGEEPIVPYQRPPLSKAYLKGETDAEDLKLKPDSFYPEHDVTLRLGTRVSAIDRASKLVLLEGGGEVPYDILILATGSANRKLALAGAQPHELLELRSLADAERLKAVLEPGKTLAIVGGGYIGLEAAASARSFQADAVVLELAPRVLARVASEPLSSFFSAYHRARGVQILTETSATAVEHGADGHVSGLTLSDGRTIPCDAVLVGVGAIGRDGLARDAGPALRKRRGGGRDGADLGPGDLRHRRHDLAAHAAVRQPHAPAGKRAQRLGAGQAGDRPYPRQAGARARGALVLVGPV